MEGREQKVADCGPVELHRRLHRRLHQYPLPVMSPGVVAEKVRPSCLTGDEGSGGDTWAGRGDGDEAGAGEAGAGEVGANEDDDAGAVGEEVVASTTLTGAAALMPADACWCSHKGSALGSWVRSDPDGANGPLKCTEATAAPVPPPPPPLPPRNTSTTTEEINSPGSKREP